jgi:hypothetical protein
MLERKTAWLSGFPAALRTSTSIRSRSLETASARYRLAHDWPAQDAEMDCSKVKNAHIVPRMYLLSLAVDGKIGVHLAVEKRTPSES